MWLPLRRRVAVVLQVRAKAAGLGVASAAAASGPLPRAASARETPCGPLSAVHVRPSGGAGGGGAAVAPLVLVHGTFHGAWFFRPLQQVLACEFGVESYALNLAKRPFKRAKTHMAEIRAALDELALDAPTLFGHSQGGLFVQQYLHEASAAAAAATSTARSGAAVLCATYRIGALRQVFLLHKRLFFDDLRGLFSLYREMFLRGRVMQLPDVEFMQRVFLNPETAFVPSYCDASPGGGTHTDPGDAGAGWGRLSVEDYHARLCEVGDGIPVHYSYSYLYALQRIPPLDLVALHAAGVGSGRAADGTDGGGAFRSLVVHAANDALFGRDCAESLVLDFGSELLACPGQAHCLVDGGWEDAFARPLGRWLVKNTARA